MSWAILHIWLWLVLNVQSLFSNLTAPRPSCYVLWPGGSAHYEWRYNYYHYFFLSSFPCSPNWWSACQLARKKWCYFAWWTQGSKVCQKGEIGLSAWVCVSVWWISPTSTEGWVIYKKRMFCSQEACYESVLWIFLCQTIPTCGILLKFHFLKVTRVSHTLLTSASAGTDITLHVIWTYNVFVCGSNFFGARAVYSVYVCLWVWWGATVHLNGWKMMTLIQHQIWLKQTLRLGSRCYYRLQKMAATKRISVAAAVAVVSAELNGI